MGSGVEERMEETQVLLEKAAEGASLVGERRRRRTVEPGLPSPIILLHHLHGPWLGEARQAFIGRGPLQDQRRKIVKLPPLLVKQS